MAKTLQSYRSYLIRETTPRDNTTYSHWITTRDNPAEAEFEVSSIDEAKAWIDGTVDAAETVAADKAAKVTKRKVKAAINKAEKKLNKHCEVMGYTEFFTNEYTENAVIYVICKDSRTVRVSCNVNTLKIKETVNNGKIKH